jgi:hypothetical protein
MKRVSEENRKFMKDFSLLYLRVIVLNFIN